MNCDTRKNSQSTYKKLTKWYEGKVDKAFYKAAYALRSIDTKGWVIPTEVQNNLADMMNAFNARRNDIYRTADDIKKYLDTFSEEESKNIVKALNGDIDSAKLSGKSLETYKRMRAVINKNADDLVKAGALDEKSKIGDYLKRYYAKHLEDSKKIAKIFNSGVYKRKDLSYEERVALGMIEDASYVIPRTIAEQRIQLLKADFFKQLADSFGEDMRLGEDWTLVENTQVGAGIYKYGALAGKWVPTPVKNMLDDAHLLKENLDYVEKYLYPVVDHIKVNVTVKNPPTHIYNVLSNVQISTMQGTIQNLPRIFDMMVNDKPKFDALLKELEPFGLDSMLKDMEKPEIFFDKQNGNKTIDIVKTILGNMYLAQGTKLGDGLRHIYDWEDKIFKVAAYDHMKREVEAQMNRPLSDAERLNIYKEAAAPYANYSTPLPKVFKVLDKTGVSPFLHYVYKSTPAVAKLIAKNPLKFAIMQVILAEAGMSIFGEKDDALKPDWAGSSSKINLFGVKEWVRFSNGWYWNAGRMMPGMKFGLMDTKGGFPGGILDIINGKTPLGYNIGSKYDNFAESIWKRFAALAENYAPATTFGRYGQRAIKKATGGELKNYYKEDMSWKELAARAFGIRHFNEGSEVAKKIRAAYNRYKHFKKTDPTNDLVYLRELNKTLESIRKQARAAGVAAKTTPKSSSTRIFKPFVVKRNLIKF